jgi:hypothetical protein
MAVVYETETPHATRCELGPYREADYLELPDQPRCELLYGRLPVTPAPSVRHQEVVGLAYRLLVDFAVRAGGRAIVSPVDVVLADHSIVQPDVENTPAGFRVRLPDGAVYRSAMIAGLELDGEPFWRAIPS